jgi:hypothetical protein
VEETGGPRENHRPVARTVEIDVEIFKMTEKLDARFRVKGV